MLTKIRCCEKGNDQFIDLQDISYIEVSDTDYCAGWLPSKGKYASVTVGMKNGHSVFLTIERTKLEVLSTPPAQPALVEWPD